MKRAAGVFGLSLDDQAAGAFYTYFLMLKEANTYVNLTAITSAHEVIAKHFLDSASLIRALSPDKLSGARLIDVGSGAGFPGLALKIVCPGLKLTLLEATGKKADFLRDVSGALKLTDVEIIKGRAEELGHDISYRERFDIAVARAVARLDTLSELCLGFVRAGGSFTAYKGADCADEAAGARRAIETMGGGNIREYEYSLPGVDIGRKLILIEKISPTPARYPRRTGVPSARPIRNG